MPSEATGLYRTDYSGRGELSARQMHLAKFRVLLEKDVTKKRPAIVFKLALNQLEKPCADIFVQAQFLAPCAEPFLQGQSFALQKHCLKAHVSESE